MRASVVEADKNQALEPQIEMCVSHLNRKLSDKYRRNLKLGSYRRKQKELSRHTVHTNTEPNRNTKNYETSTECMYTIRDLSVTIKIFNSSQTPAELKHVQKTGQQKPLLHEELT